MVAKEKGAMAGIKAFIKRYKQCRPGYTHYTTADGTQWVILKTDECINRNETRL